MKDFVSLTVSLNVYFSLVEINRKYPNDNTNQTDENFTL